MSILIMMMGQPGSGKSTFIKNAKLDGTKKIVSRDTIRFSLLSETDEYFKKEKLVFKTFIQELESGSPEYDWVIADATHLTAKSRKKVLSSIDTTLFEAIYLLWIKTPLSISLERNQKRTGREFVPESAIRNMYNSIEVPTYKEGFSQIMEITEDKYIYCVPKHKED